MTGPQQPDPQQPAQHQPALPEHRGQPPSRPGPGTAEDDGGPEEPGVDELVRVPTAEQMRALGCRLAGVLRAGDLVLLSGPLGAGKTTLTQGIGAGLGVRGSVTSPTFVIARVHPNLSAGPDLVHADAYRLGSRAEVDDLDLDTDLATAITVVEWGEGLVEDLAPSFLSVRIWADEPSAGEDRDAAAEADVRRTVQVRGWGERWREPAAADATRLALAEAN
jgi:tRNA threonylcarbamoyladenosine biosynthesis protein TsaE